MNTNPQKILVSRTNLLLRDQKSTFSLCQLERVNSCLIQLQLLLPSPSKEVLGLFLEGIYKNNPQTQTSANRMALAATEAVLLLGYTPGARKSCSTSDPSRTPSSCSRGSFFGYFSPKAHVVLCSELHGD